MFDSQKDTLPRKVFRVKAKKRKNQVKRQEKLQARLAHKGFANARHPLLQDLPIVYEIADRTRVMSAGGLGAIHTMVSKLQLPELINQRVNVLQRHLPYFESDHILSLCYSLLCGGKPLEDCKISELSRQKWV